MLLLTEMLSRKQSPSFEVRDGAHAGNQLGWNGTGWTTAAPTATLGSGDARCKMPDGTLLGLSTSVLQTSFPINALSGSRELLPDLDARLEPRHTTALPCLPRRLRNPNRQRLVELQDAGAGAL